jgi:hypothetical protein
MPQTTQPIFRLRPQDSDLPLQVETEGEDRFIVTVGAAIQACKKYEDYLQFSRQARKLLARLQLWMKTEDAKVRDAYVTVRDSAFLFLVVQRGQSFDRDLEDSLTELDLSIAQDEDLALIRLNVLALPNASEDSINSFLTFGGASV